MNSLNPEIQLKDTGYATRNKLIDLFFELKSYKLVTTLVLEFVKKKVMMRQNILPFRTHMLK